jgi:hypothetical protein
MSTNLVRSHQESRPIDDYRARENQTRTIIVQTARVYAQQTREEEKKKQNGNFPM